VCEEENIRALPKGINEHTLWQERQQLAHFLESEVKDL